MTQIHSNKHGKQSAVRSALVLHGRDLGDRVVRGAKFTILGIALRTLITLGSVSVLARLLSPADFGYMTMATVVTDLAALFGNFGFASVLIQKRVITRLQMDTVFWSSATLGLGLMLVVLMLSYFATWFFSEPTAGQLMRIMCIVFAIDGLIVVHGALISRLMHFHVDFWIQIISIALRATVAIIFAWQGFGVWSLVIGSLAGAVLRLLLSVAIIPYWPRLRFNLSYLRSTWKTNSSYFAGGLLFYANTNVDLLLIGRMVGATALGYYQNSRSLTDEVRYRIAVPLQRVLFPAFASLQENTRWLQVSVLRSGRLLAAIVFPVGIGIAAIANELVPILYGEKWLAMIPVLKLLGVSTALKGSTAIATPLFNAANRVGLSLRYNIIGSIIVVLSVVAASPWGIEAVAGAITLSALYSLLNYRVGLGLIGLGWSSVWSMLAPPMLASASMWVVIEVARALLTGHLAGGVGLVSYIALGAIVYPVALVLISPIILGDFKVVLAKIRPTAS
ncbi:MAG: lipopolysaccharide biosynthesis protein [Methylophilaceae bacterium]